MPAPHPYLAGPYPRAFAHRGWHLGELAGSENTLAALRRAVTEGYRYLEIDVHATADGVLVVHHDPTLDRTTDGSGAIAELAWSRVRRARIWGREPVASLQQVLEQLPTALLNVDVKAQPAVAPMAELLAEPGMLDRICIASFAEHRVGRLRRRFGPALMTSVSRRGAVALRVRASCPWLRPAPPVAGTLAQLPVYRGRLRVIDAAMVRTVRALGMELHAWTVDEPAEMHRLLDLGVDGLVTDRPDLLRAVLRARGSWRSAGDR